VQLEQVRLSEHQVQIAVAVEVAMINRDQPLRHALGQAQLRRLKQTLRKTPIDIRLADVPDQ
jgi:phage anti-repressor protein